MILVAEPTPFGLSDLQQTVSTLNELDIPYAVIINKSNIGSNVLHEYLVQYNIDIVTSIPFMREIAAFYANGRLVPHEIREYFSQIMAYILEFSNNLQLK
ncbi:hypothetical protein SDC9_167251 [bioreactor metagenome]|uniref:CobQ/CobB/MinD/ParA nucleotide binding domain-containing protein n=1 Tax=bioreactor metagenome TaxID=1076179 RepID=A0A645G145_9ZZZZ